MNRLAQNHLADDFFLGGNLAAIPGSVGWNSLDAIGESLTTILNSRKAGFANFWRFAPYATVLGLDSLGCDRKRRE
jgi:hypothetical protein